MITWYNIKKETAGRSLMQIIDDNDKNKLIQARSF